MLVEICDADTTHFISIRLCIFVPTDVLRSLNLLVHGGFLHLSLVAIPSDLVVFWSRHHMASFGVCIDCACADCLMASRPEL